MKKIQTWSDKQGENILMHERHKFDEAFKLFPDGRYIHTIEKVENIRSLEQNNAMWGIPYMYFTQALILCGELENPSKKDVHEWCMVNYLPNDYRERIYNIWKSKPSIRNFKTGELYKEPFRLTTTLMVGDDWKHYYEAMVRGYAENFSSGEEGDFIPDPDPNYRAKKQNVK
jgi:hypothetical protein